MNTKAIKLVRQLSKLRAAEMYSHVMFYKQQCVGTRAIKAHERYLKLSEQADRIEADLLALLSNNEGNA